MGAIKSIGHDGCPLPLLLEPTVTDTFDRTDRARISSISVQIHSILPGFSSILGKIE